MRMIHGAYITYTKFLTFEATPGNFGKIGPQSCCFVL